MWLKNKPILLVLPAVCVTGFLFFGGLLDGIMQSLGIVTATGNFQISTDAYHRLFHSEEFWQSLWLTLRISFLSTLIAAFSGMFAAIGFFLLIKKGYSRSSLFWQQLFKLPFVIPHLVAAYLIVLLFMESGWLSRILFTFGIIDQIHEFPVLVNESSGWGIILAYVWKEAPFILLMVFPVLLRIDGQWGEAAKVFGADKRNYFREILFPLLLPAWLTASFIVFAFTFSAFEVPYLLGVTYPKLLPVVSFNIYNNGELADRPEAFAINLILTFITALLGIIAFLVSNGFRSKERKGWN